MYQWATIFKDFHKAQMLIRKLENEVALTHEYDDTWIVNDYSPAQREYEDKNYKPKKQARKPF